MEEGMVAIVASNNKPEWRSSRAMINQHDDK